MKLAIALIPLLLILASPVSAKSAFGYRVTAKIPQPRENFVQGLEILDNYLYVSTGGYGTSRLLRYHFKNGQLDTGQQLNPDLFGEGVTVFGELIYQLTWRARAVLVYHKDNLKLASWFRIPGEGWGLTHDNRQLIFSDGTDQLLFLSPHTRQITGAISVTENGQPVPRLNELEWVEGRIWANIWKTDRVVIIDRANGEVTASINLQGLLPVAERHDNTDVLNGIARDPADGSIWVTGKRWPWIYQIELLPQPNQRQKNAQ